MNDDVAKEIDWWLHRCSDGVDVEKKRSVGKIGIWQCTQRLYIETCGIASGKLD